MALICRGQFEMQFLDCDCLVVLTVAQWWTSQFLQPAAQEMSFNHYNDVIMGAIARFFLSRFFRHRSKKTSQLRVTGLGAENSPEPAQMAINTENVSIWWRHHAWIYTATHIVVCAYFVNIYHISSLVKGSIIIHLMYIYWSVYIHTSPRNVSVLGTSLGILDWTCWHETSSGVSDLHLQLE